MLKENQDQHRRGHYVADARGTGGHRKAVRCMPNTPALIGAGIAPCMPRRSECPGKDGGRKHPRRGWRGGVGGRGAAARPVTGVPASGPAYVFWFVEQLAAVAEKSGFGQGNVHETVLHTVLGAARLAASSSEPPATLRKNVTSKGGTTEAALKVFDEEKLAERFMRAVEAASRRATELGSEQGKD